MAVHARTEPSVQQLHLLYLLLQAWEGTRRKKPSDKKERCKLRFCTLSPWRTCSCTKGVVCTFPGPQAPLLGVFASFLGDFPGRFRYCGTFPGSPRRIRSSICRKLATRIFSLDPASFHSLWGLGNGSGSQFSSCWLLWGLLSLVTFTSLGLLFPSCSFWLNRTFYAIKGAFSPFGP